jgi:hypothetical protein
MTLSGRPIPEVIFDAAWLADKIRPIFAETYDAVKACFEGAREAEAEAAPAPGEWSAKQILAHLIQAERGFLQFHTQWLGGNEPWQDDYGANLLGPLQATQTAFPTIPDLLGELKRLLDEEVAFTAHLPAEFVARKGSFWRYAHALITTPFTHPGSHIEQIRAALQAARAQ